jgi:hypothetical protein
MLFMVLVEARFNVVQRCGAAWNEACRQNVASGLSSIILMGPSEAFLKIRVPSLKNSCCQHGIQVRVAPSCCTWRSLQRGGKGIGDGCVAIARRSAAHVGQIVATLFHAFVLSF